VSGHAILFALRSPFNQIVNGIASLVAAGPMVGLWAQTIGDWAARWADVRLRRR